MKHTPINERSQEAFMEEENTKGSTKASRRRLSAPSKTAIAALLVVTVICGGMSVFSVVLLIIGAFMLLGAILIATGIRWTPLLGMALSGIFLYILLVQEPFPVFHLSHPKDAFGSDSLLISFIMFIVIVVLLWSSLVACVASAIAVIQNYRQRERRTPSWFTPVLSGLVGILLGAILLGLLAQPPVAATATTTTGGTPTVHMSISSFSQSSVTVPKGSKLQLIDDGSFIHILANGSWQNNQPKPGTESGAPSINRQINSGSVEIGPFTTAGTYHIFCTVHQGMNLTIIVQ